MPRIANPLPSYTLHKPSGLARARVAGRDHSLGRFGSPESRLAYARLIDRMGELFGKIQHTYTNTNTTSTPKVGFR